MMVCTLTRTLASSAACEAPPQSDAQAKANAVKAFFMGISGVRERGSAFQARPCQGSAVFSKRRIARLSA